MMEDALAIQNGEQASDESYCQRIEGVLGQTSPVKSYYGQLDNDLVGLNHL